MAKIKMDAFPQCAKKRLTYGFPWPVSRLNSMFPVRCKADADEEHPPKKARKETAPATKTPRAQQARSGAQHHTASAISPLPVEAFCCGKPDPTEATHSESGSAPWNGKPQIGPATVGKKVRRSRPTLSFDDYCWCRVDHGWRL